MDRSPQFDSLDDAPLRQLVMRVARLSRRAWLAELEPYGLSPHLARALGVVALQEEGEVRSADLAQRLRITPRSATEVVDGLVDRGLVDRVPSPSDRRAKLLSLTPEGQALWERLSQVRRSRDDSLFDVLTPPQRQILADLLRRVLQEHETEADDSRR